MTATVEITVSPEAVDALAARHRYPEQVSVFTADSSEPGVQQLVANPESREEFAVRMLQHHLDVAVAEHRATIHTNGQG